MKDSAIEWTHHTFNPWIGCTKVSPGCKNCYAAAQDHRWGQDRWGVGKARTRTSDSYWKQPIAWNQTAEKSGDRHRVFCASLADVFDDAIYPTWRANLFELISATPNLDWLLLTKRPQNILRLWPMALPGPGVDWPNVWLGTTVEDQLRADERIPVLLEVPAVVHFLSCEPLLERVDLSAFIGGPYVGIPGDVVHPNYNAGIDWVIGGGESGGGARPMAPAWAKSLRDQCSRAGVPFLLKQWGEFDATGTRVGKKVAGRLLDGVLHDGYPEVRQ